MNIEESTGKETPKQWQLEMRAYQELLDLTRDVPYFSRPEQYTLAFIIEDARQKAPEHWEQDITTLKDELQSAKEHGDLPAFTWRLAQEFNQRYIAFLGELEPQEQDSIRQKNLETLRKGLTDDMKIRQKAYQSGERVPIGTVIPEHVPEWFRFT